MGGLDQSRLRLASVREGPTLEAEHLGFEQRFGYGGAVDIDERAIAARTRAVKRTGNKTLPGAGLALDEDRRQAASVSLTLKEPADGLAHGDDPRTFTQYLREPDHRRILRRHHSPPGGFPPFFATTTYRSARRNCGLSRTSAVASLLRLATGMGRSTEASVHEGDGPMRTMTKRLTCALLAATLMGTGCASYDGRTGMETFGRGMLNLVLSPLMIAAGLAQGLAFLPYTLGMGLGELNKVLLQANAVSLDDSYKATFGVSVADQHVDQKTGDVYGQEGLYGRFKPEAIFEANRAFQRLLVSQGMKEDQARNYTLTGNYRYAWSRGHILLAVVYRHPGVQPFRAAAKQTGIVTTFRPDQRGWYEPYERDASGQAIDEVIDWAAMEYAVLRQDKLVATLMVLAAEAVQSGKRAPDYWPTERLWQAGETAAILQESADKVKRALPS